ncbi:MAG: carboxypeptidase-like regulatory domain-containing protein [Kofleriaceae bacterium]
MHKPLFAILAASLFSGCVATATTGPSRRPPPPEEVRVVDPPHREHHREPRVIEGIVLDAETHQPLARAAIDVNAVGLPGEMTLENGADGRFRTGEIPSGDFKIRCRREGYEPINRNATMGEGTGHINFEMRRRR